MPIILMVMYLWCK